MNTVKRGVTTIEDIEQSLKLINRKNAVLDGVGDDNSDANDEHATDANGEEKPRPQLFGQATLQLLETPTSQSDNTLYLTEQSVESDLDTPQFSEDGVDILSTASGESKITEF